MTFIEAREKAAKLKHSVSFYRKTVDEIVFKCEYCQGEMKFRERHPELGWEGGILKKRCSKAPKK